jgi:hypothetical protein
LANAEFWQPRIFTLEEATALLPQLREILAALRSARTRLGEGQHELEERYHGGHGNGYPAPGGRLDQLQGEIVQAQSDLDEAVRAIAGLGCELKDPDRGMVDFRTQRDGRVVYLCWLASESRISYWHELDGGYAGRQPL